MGSDKIPYTVKQQVFVVSLSKVNIYSTDKKVTNDVWYSESGLYVTMNL